MGRLHIIPKKLATNQGVNYEEIRVGQFFKIDPDDCIKYRKDRFVFGQRGGSAFNTRTGKHEGMWGIVYSCDPMTEEEIGDQQKDHQMWGEIWRNHP